MMVQNVDIHEQSTSGLERVQQRSGIAKTQEKEIMPVSHCLWPSESRNAGPNASVSRIAERECEWSILFVDLGAGRREPVGVLVLDTVEHVLYANLNRHWTASNENLQLWWDEFATEIMERSGKTDSSDIFNMLQQRASHFVTVSDAQTDSSNDMPSLLDSLYAEHVSL
jgi:hypothetical protein